MFDVFAVPLVMPSLELLDGVASSLASELVLALVIISQ